MSNIRQLEKVPEISFIENMKLQEVEELILEQYQILFKEAYGKEAELGKADPKRLLIKVFALVLYQVMQYIDAKGRAELLKTATGDALDNLATLFGITRQGAHKATARERFTLSEKRKEFVAIPAGTRVKTQSGRYFNTLAYAEIPAGELSTDTEVQAEEAGTESNALPTGSIDTLVDPIPYVAGVTNITESTGGLDVEDDDSLTERIYLAPSKFSSAGPRDAYVYYAKEWRSDVADVQVESPSPCVIAIYAVLDDGRTLNEAERESLAAYINGEQLRPLCDKVICIAPQEISYEIQFTYWIAESDKQSAGTIQRAVEAAAEAYQTWQRKLGRDINPTELIARIRAAGAKRVKLIKPVDATVENTELPKCTGSSVVYGGIEHD